MLHDSVEYFTVFQSQTMTFGLSGDLTKLRQVVLLQNNIQHQFEYLQITDAQKISNIEQIYGSEWVVQDENLSNKYLILRQRDKNNHRYSRYIKVVEMADATVKQWQWPGSVSTKVEARPECWIYYGKRRL